MEGGYVNEEDSDAIMGVESPAIISFTNTKLQNSSIYAPTTTTTFANNGIEVASSSSAPPQATSSSSDSSTIPALGMPTGNGGPFYGFVAKLRNFKFNDSKNIRKRLHFDFISKDRFLGGQLKTRNGQKYVFKGPPSGVYVSKICLLITALVFLAILLSSVVVTYILTSAASPAAESSPSRDALIRDHSNHDTYVAVNQTATTSIPERRKTFTTTAAPVDPVTVAPIGNITDDANSPEMYIPPKVRPLQLFEGWRPLHYNLVIEPNLDASASNGSLLIEIERDAHVSSWEPIVLDVHNISISNVRVLRGNVGDELELDFDSEYGEMNATFVVRLARNLATEPELRVLLSMDFVSQITDTLQGIYKTSYLNPNNQLDWVISTQFSPIDARRAFPCFDRPDMKANFTVSIIREVHMNMSLSNMPKYRSSLYRPGYIRDDFMTTPKMPTYLLAFIISKMQSSGFVTQHPDFVPKVDIWTRPTFKDMTYYAYQMVTKFLPYYEDYFGSKNQLPKIDLVSVPDFGFGAMENWGLITFRDSSLLVPQDQELASSSEHMQYVAQIVAHELAHQWFGNLVTPKWWNDLWLKEGFACYMSYKALNQVHPEYQISDTFTVLEFKESMQHDASNTSHPISFDVKTTNDVRRIFDPISYSKGTILLRMLESIVGEEAFRAATQELLKKFAYKNMDRDDLWAFLTQHGHQKGTLPKDMNVKDIMDSWIAQPGYPVVHVTRDNTDLIVRQERYLLAAQTPTDHSRWVIPITYETNELRKGDNIPTHWLKLDQAQLVIKNVYNDFSVNESFHYLNLNRQGYYRVNYDEASWLALKRKFPKLPRITRAQLLDDALNLAQAKYLTYDVPLTFLVELRDSVDDELLWSAAKPGLTYLTNNLKREPAYETFRALMKFLVRDAFNRYSLNEPDNESHLQLKHRALIANFACKFNYDRCTQAAQKNFRQWMEDANKNPIKPNLKSVIYCTALAEGSYQEWYFAYKQFKRTNSASEKEEILTSLGCTTKPWLLSKYLNLTISSNSGILKQDGALAFRAVASNAVGYEIAFDFLESNIKEIADYYGDGFLTINDMIKSLTTYMNKDYHRQQLETLARKSRKLGLKGVEVAIDLAMEQVNENIYWRTHCYENLKGYLEGFVSFLQINIF